MSGLFWSHCSITLGFPNPWLEQAAEGDDESSRLQGCCTLEFMSVVFFVSLSIALTVLLVTVSNSFRDK